MNMKTLLTLMLLNVGVVATAQTARQSTTHTQINDDGKTLSVRVEGQVDGRAIDYQRTFDVARLNDESKDALKHRIFDSLGIGEPPKPPLPLTPPHRPQGGPSVDSDSDTDQEQNVTFRCETCTGKIKLVLARSTDDYSFDRVTKIDSQKRFFPYQLPLPPGEYRLTYVQNDVLQIQSTFTVKPGQETTVVVK